MAKGFFKKNEKLFMTLLLLVIAPSFAFTGIMTAVMQSNTGSAMFEAFGETISVGDVQEIGNHLTRYLEIMSAPGRQRRGFRDDECLSHFILEYEADRLGIELSDAELQDAIRARAKDLIAWDQLMNGGIPQGGQFQILRELQNIKQSRRFTVDDYGQALRSNNIGLDISIEDFEATLARGKRVEKLLRSVQASAVVSEKEIYEEFEEQQQLRVLEIVRVPAEGFLEQARAAVAGDTDYLEDTYYQNKASFTLPDRVQLEVLKVDSVNLNLSFNPSDDELRAQYERDKNSLYVSSTGFDLDLEVDPDGPYQSFEEVKADVLAAMRTRYSGDKEVSILDDALAEAKRRKDAGETGFALLDLVPEPQRDIVQVITTEVFGADDIGTLPESIRNEPRLQTLFLGFAELQDGDFCEKPVPLSDGNFIYRIAAKHPIEDLDYDPEMEDLLKLAAENKSGELALEHLQGWVKKLEAEGSEDTLDSLAQAENYTLTTLEVATRSDWATIQVDAKPLASAFDILKNGFDIAEVGQVGEPLLARDGSEAYLVRLEETQKPDSSGFETRRASLRNSVLRRKQLAAEESFMSALNERANSKDLRPRNPNTEPGS